MAYELFFDGFETYGANGDGNTLNKYGYSNLGTWQEQGRISAAGRQADTYGFALYCVYDPSWPSYFVMNVPINASSCVVASFAFFLKAPPDKITMRFMEGTTEHAKLVLNANGKIILTAGNAVSVSSVSNLGSDSWRHLSFGLYCSTTGSYEVRIDESSLGWFSETNADTNNDGVGFIDSIQIWGGGNTSPIIDDLHIAYGNQLVWLGDCYVKRLLLTGNTATQDWTPNTGNAWERLNAGDGYVESDVDEATSLFELANLTNTSVTIKGVKVSGLIKKSSAGTREACTLVKSNSTIAESDSLVLSTDPLGVVQILKLNPDTNLSWSVSAVQALQPGLRVKA